MIHPARYLRYLALTGGLILGAAQAHASPAAGGGAAATAKKDLHSRRGYLALSPGVIGIALAEPNGPPPRYIWGIEGGYHFPLGRSLMVQPGLVFEHSAYRQADAATVDGPLSRPRRAHLIRLGPQVRLGGGNAKVFGYALFSVTSGVRVFDRIRADHLQRVAFPQVSSSIGGGVQGLIIGKLLVGGELNVDFQGFALFMRARLHVGIMF